MELNIWRLADAFVAKDGEAIRARADLLVIDVQNVGLRVERKEPPIRHASITGWSAEKAAQMSKAQQLAAIAKLELRQP
jgi:hypothetical protein